jgi:hypothetical protein
MIGKLCLVGIGYVLGTRAGRDRYEQIRVVAGHAAKRLERYGARGSLASHINAHASSSSGADSRSR